MTYQETIETIDVLTFRAWQLHENSEGTPRFGAGLNAVYAALAKQVECDISELTQELNHIRCRTCVEDAADGSER